MINVMMNSENKMQRKKNDRAEVWGRAMPSSVPFSPSFLETRQSQTNGTMNKVMNPNKNAPRYGMDFL
jgi:hypothetical protein